MSWRGRDDVMFAVLQTRYALCGRGGDDVMIVVLGVVCILAIIPFCFAIIR